MYMNRQTELNGGRTDPASVARWQKKGVDHWSTCARNAEQDPDHFYSSVATIGGNVVGFANAVVSEDEPPYTWWKGLVVARSYDGKGVGSRLEAARYTWARALGHIIRAHIVPTNQRSLVFFQNRGFKRVGTRPATEEVPFSMYIMERRPD